MKLLKKFGIGFLALIICVCSCFKFVNAETLPPVSDEFVLTSGNTYNLIVYNAFDYNVSNQLQVGFDVEKGYSLIFYYEEDRPLIFIMENDVPLFEPIVTYLKTDNNYYYFTFDYTPLFSFNGILDDQSVAFIETYNGNFSVYNSIYGLIENYLFGGDIPTNSYQELTATLLSGTICIFVFALPFLIVWKTIRIIMG